MEEKYYMFKILKKYPEIIQMYSKKPININGNQISLEERENVFKEIESDFHYTFRKRKGCIQTHSANVCSVTEENLEEEFTDCDGLLTNRKGIALIIKTADCQSIFLYDSKHQVIGNIHSGWKGTLNTIVCKAIQKMQQEYASKPKDLIACISPSIGQCCFEVDLDVYQEFKKQFPYIDDYTRKGNKIEGKQKYYIDTKALNKKILMDMGIKEENIEISPSCTKCENHIYHSYRAEKDKAGRNMSLIAIKE